MSDLFKTDTGTPAYSSTEEQIVIATTHMKSMAIALAVAVTGWPAGPTPKLVNTCLITSNVKRLVEFYEPVLQLKATKSGEDYAEFPSDAGVLAIFSAGAQEKYMPGSAEGGKNRGVILEFKVSDVDQEYRRLQNLVKIWVKPPADQPWGTHSIYFRDPDGNLVDFYAPIKK